MMMKLLVVFVALVVCVGAAPAPAAVKLDAPVDTNAHTNAAMFNGVAIKTTGGTAGGASCGFPFTYKKIIYNSCAKVDNRGVPWCYTTGIKWGNCIIAAVPVEYSMDTIAVKLNDLDKSEAEELTEDGHDDALPEDEEFEDFEDEEKAGYEDENTPEEIYGIEDEPVNEDDGQEDIETVDAVPAVAAEARDVTIPSTVAEETNGKAVFDEEHADEHADEEEIPEGADEEEIPEGADEEEIPEAVETAARDTKQL